MSTEVKTSAVKGGPNVGGQPGATRQAATSDRSQEISRRVFICYPRKFTAETATFENALRDCLQILDPNFTVFRDVTDRNDESLEVGEDWTQAIDHELDTCVCCLVVLVPAIFDRPQCVREIEYFNQRITNGEKCFFFPVAFLPVQDEFTMRLQANHPVARILDSRHHYDFINSWTETQQTLYKAKVLKIAQLIHNRVRSLQKEKPRVPVAAPDSEPAGRRAPVARRTWAYGLASLLALGVVVVVAAWFFIAAPPPPAGVEWIALPAETRYVNWSQSIVHTYAEPDRQSERSVSIEPGQVIPSSAEHTLQRATVKGEVWLRFPLGNTAVRAYVPASDLKPL
jgi:hypothetical protein